MDRKQRKQAIQRLIETNFEFKKLHQEHETLEAKIQNLDKQKFLSPEDEKRRKELQKKKLNGKDLMEQMVIQKSSPRA